MAECDSLLHLMHKRTKIQRKRCDLPSQSKGEQLHQAFKGWDKSLSLESICTTMSWGTVGRVGSLLYNMKVEGKLLSFALPWSFSSPVWYFWLSWDSLQLILGMPNCTCGKNIIYVMTVFQMQYKDPVAVCSLIKNKIQCDILLIIKHIVKSLYCQKILETLYLWPYFVV